MRERIIAAVHLNPLDLSLRDLQGSGISGDFFLLPCLPPFISHCPSCFSLKQSDASQLLRASPSEQLLRSSSQLSVSLPDNVTSAIRTVILVRLVRELRRCYSTAAPGARSVGLFAWISSISQVRRATFRRGHSSVLRVTPVARPRQSQVSALGSTSFSPLPRFAQTLSPRR